MWIHSQPVKFKLTSDPNWGGKESKKWKATEIVPVGLPPPVPNRRSRSSPGTRTRTIRGGGAGAGSRPARPRPSPVKTSRNFDSSGPRSPRSASGRLETSEVGADGRKIIFPSTRWRPSGSRDNSPTRSDGGFHSRDSSPRTPEVRFARGPDGTKGFAPRSQQLKADPPAAPAEGGASAGADKAGNSSSEQDSSAR